MDKHTFGKSPAAERLVEIIKNHPECHRLISRCFNDYAFGVKKIKLVPDITIREELLKAWYETHKSRVQNTILPSSVKSFLLNVENTLMKVEIANVNKEIHSGRGKHECFLELGNPKVKGCKDWFATFIAFCIWLEGMLPCVGAWICGYRVRILVESKSK